MRVVLKPMTATLLQRRWWSRPSRRATPHPSLQHSGHPRIEAPLSCVLVAGTASMQDGWASWRLGDGSPDGGGLEGVAQIREHPFQGGVEAPAMVAGSARGKDCAEDSQQ